MSPSPSPSALVDLARRWLACFATKDVDTLVGLYAADATHTSPKIRALHPETGGLLRGRDAMRAWWADAFRRLPALAYVEESLTADGQRVWMEYLRKAPGEPDLPVAEVLDVGPDGRITASRVYHG
jgi:ketosteroid isomerase-like protein